RVADLSSARPLSVILREREVAALAAVGPDSLELERGADVDVPVDRRFAVGTWQRDICRPSTRGIVHGIDDVSLFEQAISPTWPSVRRLKILNTCLAVRVEQDH